MGKSGRLKTLMRDGHWLVPTEERPPLHDPPRPETLAEATASLFLRNGSIRLPSHDTVKKAKNRYFNERIRRQRRELAI